MIVRTISRVFRVAVHVGNKGPVDFQGVDWNPPQAAERGITGAKIVDAQANAECLQLRENVTRFFRVSHGDRLYDFELQAAWINPGLLKRVTDLAD